MKKFRGKIPSMSVYNKPSRTKWNSEEVETTLVEIMPQARQAFDKVCDVNKLRNEVLQDVDILTAGSAQPPDPVVTSCTMVTMAQIEIAPSETSKVLFWFQVNLPPMCLAWCLALTNT